MIMFPSTLDSDACLFSDCTGKRLFEPMVERLVDADVIELQVRVTRTASPSIPSLSPYHHPHDTTIPPIDMSKATEKHIYLTRHAEAEHK